MKIKVKLYDKSLFTDYLAFITVISTFYSFFTIIVDVENKYKIFVGLGLFVLLILIYLNKWRAANKKTESVLKVDNSTIVVKVGDIFVEDGLKVIGFNEYFDTIVGERMISENSLNGIYLNRFAPKIGDLDRLIERDEDLQAKVIGINENRLHGKRIKYRLGTIFKQGDYLLTAFSRFDEKNRAYLSINDYINLLLNMWNEVDAIYSGRSVTIPLMGSGITRFREYTHISEQELLELLLWSFKISRIKFTYPSKVTIVIHESKKDKINFYKLKEVI